MKITKISPRNIQDFRCGMCYNFIYTLVTVSIGYKKIFFLKNKCHCHLHVLLIFHGVIMYNLVYGRALWLLHIQKVHIEKQCQRSNLNQQPTTHPPTFEPSTNQKQLTIVK